jgi:hypothetical protein
MFVIRERLYAHSVYQQPGTMATGLEDRHQPLDEHLGALCYVAR